ncbi:hypothetical protein Tco_1454988, partial [Tanacetum coccineum]
DFDEGNNTKLRYQRKDKDVMGVDHVECEVTVEKGDKISSLGNGNSMNTDLNMGKEDEISSLGKDNSMDKGMKGDADISCSKGEKNNETIQDISRNHEVSNSPDLHVKQPANNIHANASNYPIKPSYASIASYDNATLNRNLEFEPTVTENGTEFVIFDEEMVKTGSLKWNLTVCGHFVGMKMPYNEVIYNLRRMWGKHGLGEILIMTMSIGKPLVMDAMTASMYSYGRGRLGYARVLIEVNAKKKFKEVCELCHVFGHSTKMCKKRPKSVEEMEQNKMEEDRNTVNKDGFTNARRRQEAPKASNRIVNEKSSSFNGTPVKNKYAVKDECDDEGNGRKLNQDQVNEVEYFVKQRLQPTPFETNKWSHEMVNFFKDRWEKMIDKGQSCNTPKIVSQRKCVRGRYFIIHSARYKRTTSKCVI